MSIIGPVNFSDWTAPIVVVKISNGSGRSCANYSSGPNKVLEAHQYHLLLPEISSPSCTLVFFGKLDFLGADECKDSIINTNKGLFQYNRSAFGVKTEVAIF